ncbi:hypothetical protein E2C01_091828 [Portunus trituberculatus]|uniref:Uncharacterized protein n=1 Tax=Portunus trituberculatus TaxID=210409 RepID=A0A5B7JW48_PORTR|nr:hypothetical protein [Portunus trituberculatus]
MEVPRDGVWVTGSKGERDGGVHQHGMMSVNTKFKQRKERKPEQPLPASAWATPHLGWLSHKQLTCRRAV